VGTVTWGIAAVIPKNLSLRLILLDKDLAELYQVTTGNLNKAVKRNIKRFPSDFMFQLNKEEFNNTVTMFAVANGMRY